MTDKQYWERLKRSGWLASVPRPQQAGLRMRVKAALAADPKWAFLALVSGVADSECVYASGDYSTLLRIYSDASYGGFNPTHISDTLDEDDSIVTIRFKLRGKAFRTVVPITGDVVAPEFGEFVNEALKEARVPERFVELPTDDQTIALAFVKPKAFKAAVTLGLVPDIETFCRTEILRVMKGGPE